MSEHTINREAIEQAAVTSVGSKIFASNINIGGVPTQVISSACRMSVQQFMHDYEGEDGFLALESRYKAFDTHASNCFFNFDTGTAVDDYAVYTFNASSDWLQLKKLETPVPSNIALAVFRELIKLLINYKNSPINRRKYSPLLSICKESVYVSFDENDNVSVRLLPTRYDPTSQYPGLPREIFIGRSDITSDIFMAAYLYLEMRYPNGEAFKNDEYEKFDLIAERCISPFTGRRYGLEELLSLLTCQAADTADEKEKKEEKEAKAEEITENGDTSYHIHSDLFVTTKKAAPKNDKISSFFDKLGRKKAKSAKKARKITDKVSDRFDSVVSTEQGDNEENE